MTLHNTIELPLDALRPWPKAANLFPKYSQSEMDDLQAFAGEHGADSILPIVVSADYFIVDGYNRVTAAEKRGDKSITCQVWSYGSDREMEIHAICLNAKRRHLDAVSMARAAKRLAELYRPAPEDVKAKLSEAGKQGGRGNEKARTPASVHPLERESATEKAAREVGVSQSTVRAVAKVDATQDPVLINAMETKTVSIEKAAQLSKLPEEDRRIAINAAVESSVKGWGKVADALKPKHTGSLFVASCIDANIRLRQGIESTNLSLLEEDDIKNCIGALGGVLTLVMEIKAKLDGEIAR